MRTGTFYWKTEEYHHDNTFTLNDWLKNQMEDDVYIMYEDDNYCEVKDVLTGESYSLMASGNGDSYNHKIEIK